MVKVGRAKGGQLTNGYFEVDRGENTGILGGSESGF
jgi:hypothetical protein